MLLSEIKNWYAVYVNSRAEKKVTELLLLKNIEVYLPLIKTMKQWSDRKKLVEMPLLNGYVFVHITDIEKEKVLQTKGVVSFVKSERKSAIIKQVEIDRLKQLISLGYHMETSSLKIDYREGDKIKIISGVLKGIEGFVTQNKEGKFIDIVLESIGQTIKVKLPEEIVTPI